MYVSEAPDSQTIGRMELMMQKITTGILDIGQLKDIRGRQDQLQRELSILSLDRRRFFAVLMSGVPLRSYSHCSGILRGETTEKLRPQDELAKAFPAGPRPKQF